MSAPEETGYKSSHEAPRRWAGAGKSREDRSWRAGWNHEEDTCPPDPRGNSRPGQDIEWRESGLFNGQWWQDQHIKRRQVQRELRRAGYVARNRWARRQRAEKRVGPNVVRSYVYEDGPAEGYEAVDPWQLATAVQFCGAGWDASLRLKSSGELGALAIPRLCGRGHVCPVCAAVRAGARSRALRTLIQAQLATDPDSRVVLVTLTQRAKKGEPLAAAVERLKGGWRRMTRGRPGERWREVVSDWFWGREVTWSTDAGWWHAHMHVLVRIPKGVDEQEARASIGREWQRASARAAAAAGLTDYGWNPHAGGCEMAPYVEESPVVSREVRSWAGSWWRAVDPASKIEVYQACKYPVPVAELRAAQLAEFVAVAHRQKWHDGGGEWRAWKRLATELELENAVNEAEPAEGAPPRVELGVNVASMAPRECPRVDDLAADLGWDSPDTCAPTVPLAIWKLSNSAPPEVLCLVRELGGEVNVDLRDGSTWVGLPASWAAASLREHEAALRESRTTPRPVAVPRAADGPPEAAPSGERAPPSGCPLPTA